jgi:protocatechuate 3,4-dioxygenase beta subunit
VRPLLGRRDLMTAMGATALAPLLACAREAEQVAAAAPGRLIAGTTCPVTPRQTEGPFYFDPKLVRRDVRDGRPGVPMRLRLQVVRSADCAPVAGSRVDVWHCDSAGTYSGYDSERSAGEAWLRGTQFADSNGVATFETIFPGWYGGRATHIHCKAWLPDGRGEISTQLYFPDALVAEVHSRRPYRRTGRSLRNEEDGIFSSLGGAVPMAEVAGGPAGFDAALVLALR